MGDPSKEDHHLYDTCYDKIIFIGVSNGKKKGQKKRKGVVGFLSVCKQIDGHLQESQSVEEISKH